MTMTDIDWKQWPQLEFEIEYYDDVRDWVANRFGDEDKDVLLVGKGTYNFHIAVRDPKILNFAILKFKECAVRPNEYEQEVIREEIAIATEKEIKRLLEELNGKIKDLPTFEAVKNAVKEDRFFSYENGVWTDVKE
jgi:hypothetical protein